VSNIRVPDHTTISLCSYRWH